MDISVFSGTFSLIQTVSSLEAFDSACSINQLLFSSKEGMTGGA
jgi:hypothetical protein